MEKLFVKDMSCQHCVMKINKALQGANIQGQVDLQTKTVSTNDPEKALPVLAKIGYPAVKVK